MSSQVVVLGRVLFATTVGVFLPCAAVAQQPILIPVEPPTKIEALMAKQGTLIVYGSSRIGAVRAVTGALITVASRELTDVGTGERALGVAIEVRTSAGRDPDRVSYVDLDEIPPLLDALDYMGRVQRTETTLDRFEARYLTRGGLLVSVFDTGHGMEAAVSSGVAGNGTTEIEFGEFQRLRQLLQLGYDALSALPVH
jgi:hypothetical protein